MPLLILIIAMFICVLSFADVLSGSAGNKRLKKMLYEFYFSLEIGDWTVLYSGPASAISKFMEKLLDRSPRSLRYVIRSTMISILFTTVLYLVSLTAAYVHIIVNEQHCLVPGIGQFLEIGPYMWTFLKFVYVSNALADYVTWSVTQILLRRLKDTQSAWAAVILIASVVLAFGMVFIMYLVYLPMSIMVEMWKYGVAFGLNSYVQIMTSNIGGIPSLFRIPDYVFTLECDSPTSHTLFSISAISTMRILAIEVTTPIALLFLSTLFGVLVSLTRPVTKAPLSYLVSRLDEYPRGAIVAVGVLLSAAAALLVAVVKYIHP